MRHRVATPLFAARIPSTTSAPRIIYTQQRTALRRSSSFSSTTLEKIAKSIYREILRECAGKQRARSKVTAVNALSPHLNLPPSSSSSPTTKETNTKGAIPFRVRALLANNLREAFRAARDDDEAKTKVNENEKIANNIESGVERRDARGRRDGGGRDQNPLGFARTPAQLCMRVSACKELCKKVMQEFIPEL